MNKYKNWHFVDFGGIRHYFSGLTDEQMMNMKIERLKIPERSNVLACFGVVIHKEEVKDARKKKIFPATIHPHWDGMGDMVTYDIIQIVKEELKGKTLDEIKNLCWFKGSLAAKGAYARCKAFVGGKTKEYEQDMAAWIKGERLEGSK